MSLNGAILAHKTGDYTVTRRALPTVTAGRAVAGSTSTFSIAASIQPVSGRALKDMPEGRRADEMRLVLCAEELRTTSPAGESDLIAYRGESWEVVKAEYWEHWGGSHCRAYIERRSTSS